MVSNSSLLSPQRALIAPAVAAINHLLAHEAWARDALALHAGKEACIDTGHLQLRARVARDGMLEASNSDEPANVTIRLKLSDLPLIAPPAGTYEVWVYGFTVSAADTALGNAVGIDIVQGPDLTVTGVPAGPVPANTPITLHGTYVNAVTSANPYEAELLLGPTVAPTAVTVPITVHGN